MFLVLTGIPCPALFIDIGKYINPAAPFREPEVDAYFTQCERIAAAVKWPMVAWLLLQSKSQFCMVMAWCQKHIDKHSEPM